MSDTGAFGSLSRRWRLAAVGRETEMAVNRLVAGVAVGGCAWPLIADPTAFLWVTGIACGYLALGGLVLVHLLTYPKASPVRRGAALLLDMVATTSMLLAAGGPMAWFFSAFLWIIFGNGFRFGPRFLIAAMLLSICGFGVVGLLSSYWRSVPSLTLGVLVGLTILPLYALTLLNRLSQATREAEEANQAKSLFLASVSHELRTPLNAIIGMGALLNESRLDRDQAEMSETISTSATALLSLIDGILDLSRIEAGRMPRIQESFNLAELLRNLRIMFLPGARQKGLRFHVHVAAELPLALLGDVRRLREILLNLLGNALKFTQSGTIGLRVTMVGRGASSCRIRFEVIDSGIGIAPAAQESIFETFSQADETIVERFGGTGLGLAISRKLARLLGGDIGVISELGCGSRFWLELDFATERSDTSAGRPNFSRVHAYLLGDRPENFPDWRFSLGEMGVAVDPAEIDWRCDPALAWLDELATGSFALVLQVAPPDGDALPFAAALTLGNLFFVSVGPEPAAPNADTAWLSHLALPFNASAVASVLHVAASLGAVTRPAAENALPVARERFHVLVADDNSINRRVMTRLLTATGHDVTVADDGEQALDLLAERRFDVAIFDVNMPFLGGIEATKLYRMSAVGGPTVPILALTADATANTRQNCLDAGMQACLVKPLEPKKLIEAIDDAVNRTRQQNPFAARSFTAGSQAREPPLDPGTLASLNAIGGPVFAAEIAEDFRLEARLKLRLLHEAASARDVAAFRAGAHALRSIAANIGAMPLCELCQPYQTISADQLDSRAERYLDQIEAELDRLDDALAAFSNRAIQLGG